MAKPKSAPYKTETEKDVTFAEGGDTPMFGQGDRTVTAPAEGMTGTAATAKERP